MMALLMVQRCKLAPPRSIAPRHSAPSRFVSDSDRTQSETYCRQVIHSRSSVDLSVLVKQEGS